MTEKFKITKNWKDAPKIILETREEEPNLIRIYTDKDWKQLKLNRIVNQEGEVIINVKIKR